MMLRARGLVRVRVQVLVLVLVLVLGAESESVSEDINCLSPGFSCDCGPGRKPRCFGAESLKNRSEEVDCSSPRFNCTCGPAETITEHTCVGSRCSSSEIHIPSMKYCSDLDECEQSADVCDPDAVCFNTDGSYYCECLFGFRNLEEELSPTSARCEDINECEEAELNEEDVCGVGTCENLAGSFWCQCPSGFTNYGNFMTPCSELHPTEVIPDPLKLPEIRTEVGMSDGLWSHPEPPELHDTVILTRLTEIPPVMGMGPRSHPEPPELHVFELSTIKFPEFPEFPELSDLVIPAGLPEVQTDPRGHPDPPGVLWRAVDPPQVRVSEGEWAPRPGGGVFVLMGSHFRVTCSMGPMYLVDSFQLKSPTLNITQPAVNNSAHFLFTDAGPAHKGNYTCVYNWRTSTSSSSLNICPIEPPEVGVSVSEGEWEPRPRGGVFVLRGGDFQVTCSVEFPLLGGFFHLTSPTISITLPAINNSAHFLFINAGHAHKGNYTCVHVLQEFNLNITSSGSLHIRPGDPAASFLLRALILALMMLLNFIPYICYKREVARLIEATRGRRRSRRAAAEPGADAVSEMI